MSGLNNVIGSLEYRAGLPVTNPPCLALQIGFPPICSTHFRVSDLSPHLLRLWPYSLHFWVELNSKRYSVTWNCSGIYSPLLMLFNNLFVELAGVLFCLHGVVFARILIHQ